MRFKRKWQVIPYWHNTVAIRILFAVIIIVFIGIGIFSLSSSQYKEDSKVLNNGSHIIGTVTKKYFISGGSDGGETYHVRYVFTPPGGEGYKGHGEIDYQDWEQMEVEWPIEIVFDPEDPSQNVPVLVDRSVFEYYYATILASIFAFFIVLLVLFVLPPLIIRSIHKIHNKRLHKSIGVKQ